MIEIAPIQQPEHVVDVGEGVDAAAICEQGADGQQLGAVGRTVAISLPVAERRGGTLDTNAGEINRELAQGDDSGGLAGMTEERAEGGKP